MGSLLVRLFCRPGLPFAGIGGGGFRRARLSRNVRIVRRKASRAGSLDAGTVQPTRYCSTLKLLPGPIPGHPLAWAHRPRNASAPGCRRERVRFELQHHPGHEPCLERASLRHSSFDRTLHRIARCRSVFSEGVECRNTGRVESGSFVTVKVPATLPETQR